MHEFKPGQVVKRTVNTWRNMTVGCVDTVVRHDSDDCVTLKQFGGGHCPNTLELAEYLTPASSASPDMSAPSICTVAEQRKATPVHSGVLKYFPDALQAVAQCSKVGNDQHNPGEPLHWARGKSGDELDALTRHLLDAGTIDTDGVRHSTKVAWRALANLQKELEKAGETNVPTVDTDS